MIPHPQIWQEVFSERRLLQLYYVMPYHSDKDLDEICTGIATNILKEAWRKLRDKRRPWKIIHDSKVYDMTDAGKKAALHAIRMGYEWHMACFEKDNLRYLTRAVQCNKKLYSLLQDLRVLYIWKALDDKILEMLVELAFRVDSTTHQIVDTNGREVFRRDACTYDMEIETLREVRMSKKVLEQNKEKLRDKINDLKEQHDANFKNISLWLGGERFAWDERNKEASWVERHRRNYVNMRELVLAESQLNKCISWLHSLEKKGQTPQANESNTPAEPNGDVKEEIDQVSTRVTETNGVKRTELRERSILYGRMVTRFFMAFGKRKHPMAKAIGWEALCNVSELGALCYAASAETTYPNFRHNFDTCKQTLYGLFYWMKLLTDAEVFQSVKKRGSLCLAGLGLYVMMLDVARNGGFIPDQGKEKQRGKAAEAETSSMPGNETVTLEMVQERCERVAKTVRKVCNKCPCDTDGVAGVLIQRANDCGDRVFIYSKKIGRYDFFDMVTYCEKQARMCEYYLLLAEEFLPYHKDRFVFIRQKISALAELLSLFSVHNNIEQAQKYNLPFPEPDKKRKSQKRPQHEDEETKKDGSGATPEPSGK